MKSLSAKSEGQGERVSPEEKNPGRVQKAVKATHETKMTPVGITRSQRDSQESFIALEELSESGDNASLGTTPERQENKNDGEYSMVKKASGPEHLSEVKTGMDDSQRKPRMSKTDKQENEEENASIYDKEGCTIDHAEDQKSQDTPEGRNVASQGAPSLKQIKIESDLTNQESSTSLASVSRVHNRTDERIDSKKDNENNGKEQDDHSKAQEKKSKSHKMRFPRSIFSKKQESKSHRNPSKEQEVNVEAVHTSKEEVENVEKSTEGGQEENINKEKQTLAKDEQSDGNTASLATTNSKPETKYLGELEVVNIKDVKSKKEAKYADTSENDVHQTERSSENQSEKKKNPFLDANSDTKETETGSSDPDGVRQRAEEDEKTEDVSGAKTGAQAQEKRRAVVAEERSGSMQGNESSVSVSQDIEREKGPTRSSNDHIASLMKLYGGMKVDMKKKRPSKKSKTAKTTKKGN